MVNATGPIRPAIRCRQIGDADIAAVAQLLTRGFPDRTRDFWNDVMRRLQEHEPPPGLPKYGYLLEAGEVPVGALLVICSTVRDGERMVPRCNLSSWFVEPAFRTYAPLLVSRALSHKDVTYLNVSAAPHTWPIIEAQGFSRYCNGIFIAIPMLNGLFGGVQASVSDARQTPTVAFDAFERELLLRHAEHGCISLWCSTAERAHPFVFRSRRTHAVPFVQLIYCREIGDFVRLAGPIGRYLVRRGRPLVVIDSNDTIPGLVGVFRGGSMPRYFKGPRRPRVGDLAYTEYGLLGV